MEEVKNQTRSKNFYLTAYNQIKEGIRPSEICRRFNILKNKLGGFENEAAGSRKIPKQKS